jgi:hypothetical protein
MYSTSCSRSTLTDSQVWPALQVFEPAVCRPAVRSRGRVRGEAGGFEGAGDGDVGGWPCPRRGCRTQGAGRRRLLGRRRTTEAAGG